MAAGIYVTILHHIACRITTARLTLRLRSGQAFLRGSITLAGLIVVCAYLSVARHYAFHFFLTAQNAESAEDENTRHDPDAGRAQLLSAKLRQARLPN